MPEGKSVHDDGGPQKQQRQFDDMKLLGPSSWQKGCATTNDDGVRRRSSTNNQSADSQICHFPERGSSRDTSSVSWRLCDFLILSAPYPRLIVIALEDMNEMESHSVLYLGSFRGTIISICES